MFLEIRTLNEPLSSVSVAAVATESQSVEVGEARTVRNNSFSTSLCSDIKPSCCPHHLEAVICSAMNPLILSSDGAILTPLY